jgi:hypothetical protein
MLTYLATGFLIWAVLKMFEMGTVTRMVPQILLATIVHAPYLIGVVTGGSSKKDTGNYYVCGVDKIVEKICSSDENCHRVLKFARVLISSLLGFSFVVVCIGCDVL